MDQVFVTNKNDFVHTDRYNGQDYVFAPGDKVAVSVEVAQFFFGFLKPDKTEALLRTGWANPRPGMSADEASDEGAKILANFVFTKAVMVEEPIADVAPPADEEAAAA